MIGHAYHGEALVIGQPRHSAAVGHVHIRPQLQLVIQHVDTLLVTEDNLKQGQKLHVYRNILETGHNWIGVKLREEGVGRSPIGAKITLLAAGANQFGHIVSGETISAQHAPTMHFGLGNTDRVDAIEVRWPDGTVKRLDSPELNEYHTVLTEIEWEMGVCIASDSANTHPAGVDRACRHSIPPASPNALRRCIARNYRSRFPGTTEIRGPSRWSSPESREDNWPTLT